MGLVFVQIVVENFLTFSTAFGREFQCDKINISELLLFIRQYKRIAVEKFRAAALAHKCKTVALSVCNMAFSAAGFAAAAVFVRTVSCNHKRQISVTNNSYFTVTADFIYLVRRKLD